MAATVPVSSVARQAFGDLRELEGAAGVSSDRVQGGGGDHNTDDSEAPWANAQSPGHAAQPATVPTSGGAHHAGGNALVRDGAERARDRDVEHGGGGGRPDATQLLGASHAPSQAQRPSSRKATKACCRRPSCGCSCGPMCRAKDWVMRVIDTTVDFAEPAVVNTVKARRAHVGVCSALSSDCACCVGNTRAGKAAHTLVSCVRHTGMAACRLVCCVRNPRDGNAACMLGCHACNPRRRRAGYVACMHRCTRACRRVLIHGPYREWDDDAVSRVQGVQYVHPRDAATSGGATFVLLDRDVLWLADGGSLQHSLRHDGKGDGTKALLEAWDRPITGDTPLSPSDAPLLNNHRLHVFSFWPYPRRARPPKGPQWVVAFLFESSTQRNVKHPSPQSRVLTLMHTRVAVWDVKQLTAHELLMPAPNTVSLGAGVGAPCIKWSAKPRVVELHSLDHLLIGVCESGSATYVGGAALPADVALVWDARRPRSSPLLALAAPPPPRPTGTGVTCNSPPRNVLPAQSAYFAVGDQAIYVVHGGTVSQWPRNTLVEHQRALITGQDAAIQCLPFSKDAVLDLVHAHLNQGAGKLFEASPSLKAHVTSQLVVTGVGPTLAPADWAASVAEQPPTATAAHYCHASRTLYCGMTVLGNTHLLLSLTLPFLFKPPDQRKDLTYTVGVVGWWRANDGEPHRGEVATPSLERPCLSRPTSASGVEERKHEGPKRTSAHPVSTTSSHSVALSASAEVVACVWDFHVRAWTVSGDGRTDDGAKRNAADDAVNNKLDAGAVIVGLPTLVGPWMRQLGEHSSWQCHWHPNVVVVDDVPHPTTAARHTRVVITTTGGRALSVFVSPRDGALIDNAVAGSIATLRKTVPNFARRFLRPVDAWQPPGKVTCLGVRGNVVLAGYSDSRLVTADPCTGVPHPIVRAVKLRDLVQEIVDFSSLAIQFATFPLSASFPWSSAADVLEFTVPLFHVHFVMDIRVYFAKLGTAVTIAAIAALTSAVFVKGLLAWRARRADKEEDAAGTAPKSYAMRTPCGALPVAFTAQLVGGALVIPLLRTFMEAWDCTEQDSGVWTWDRDTTSGYSAVGNNTVTVAGSLHHGDYPCFDFVHMAVSVLALVAAATTVLLSTRLVAAGMALDRVEAWLPEPAALVRTDSAPYRGPFTASYRKPLTDLINLVAKVATVGALTMLTQRTTLLAVVFAAVAALLFLVSVLLPTYKSPSLQMALRAARLLGVWCCGLGLATVIVDDTSNYVTSVLLLAGWVAATVAVVLSIRPHAKPLCKAVCSSCRRCCVGNRGTRTTALDDEAATKPGANGPANRTAGYKRDDALAAMLLERVARYTATQPARSATSPSQHGAASVGDAGGTDGSQVLPGPLAGSGRWRSLRRVMVPAVAFTAAAHAFPAFPAWRPHMAFGAEQGRPRSLFEAAAQGDVQAVRECMPSTAKPDALHPKAGVAALHLAAVSGSAATVIELLAHKCGVNVASTSGDTALTLAVRKGSAECVAALLAVDGIDVNVANKGGKTALSLARAAGHASCVAALEGYGAAE